MSCDRLKVEAGMVGLFSLPAALFWLLLLKGGLPQIDQTATSMSRFTLADELDKLTSSAAPLCAACQAGGGNEGLDATQGLTELACGPWTVC